MSYAQPFRGQTATSVYSLPNSSLPLLVSTFGLVNTGASTIGVSVYMVGSISGVLPIIPPNTQINSGAMYTATKETILLATEVIKVQASGNVAFDFIMENIDI